MRYYRTNAIYKSINEQNLGIFLAPKGNSWFLVYGDSSCAPKVIVFVYGSSISCDFDYLERAKNGLSYLSLQQGIPFVTLSFDDSIEEVTSVTLVDGERAGEIPLNDLKTYFSKLGLSVKSGLCKKAINDARSSAYHGWQRENLGSIVVADIDLIRLGEDSNPIEIIELKRSYIPLSQWTPFRADYANFNLLSNLTIKNTCFFIILYNLRTKSPWFDDPSSVTLFKYYQSKGAEKIGQYAFEDFVAGKYLNVDKGGRE